MSSSRDPHWQSLLDASDAEEAWLEMLARQDRREEYAPTSAPGATSIATTAPQGPTVDQVDGLPALPPALREGGSSALARPLVVSQTDDDPTGRTPLSRPVGESECSTCHGEGVIAVSEPDSFGNVETDDCHCQIPAEGA